MTTKSRLLKMFHEGQRAALDDVRIWLEIQAAAGKTVTIDLAMSKLAELESSVPARGHFALARATSAEKSFTDALAARSELSILGNAADLDEDPDALARFLM